MHICIKRPGPTSVLRRLQPWLRPAARTKKLKRVAIHYHICGPTGATPDSSTAMKATEHRQPLWYVRSRSTLKKMLRAAPGWSRCRWGRGPPPRWRWGFGLSPRWRWGARAQALCSPRGRDAREPHSEPWGERLMQMCEVCSCIHK